MSGILDNHTRGSAASFHRTYIGSIERAERNVSIDNIERISGSLKS